ncbi:MAG: M23 family metallopeptidase [Roseovarius sp.]|nr:M23 family metallopeptidase [Roseovarius sp.]
MRPTLAIRLHDILERHFPERRVFLRSDTDTRFIRLRPGTQVIAAAGACAIVAWTIIATAVLVMDSIGAGNFREQAKRELQTYEARLNALADERDRRAQEAVAAQERFSSALAQISAMQSELLASETRARELETGLEVVQSTLRRAMSDRETAEREATRLATALDAGEDARPDSAPGAEGDPTVEVLTAALADAARERDDTVAEATQALRDAEDMAYELRLVNERNSEIFSRLEDAMAISVEPLEKMFRKAGLDPDTLIDTVRRGYSGRGGPLTPISVSTRGTAPSPEDMRANRILTRLDELNLYRLAADKVPLAMPVNGGFRFTSGFGMRWGRLHAGTDFAAAHGTPIYATADGVVTHAGWLSGYGQLVKIKHAFGIETRYAHQSRIRVREGQRVSRGDRIGDMGNTGRSTGTHLHYEVRVDGKAINPMTYIKAARDVF